MHHIMTFWSTIDHIYHILRCMAYDYNRAEKFLSPSDIISFITSQHNTLIVHLLWCWYKQTHFISSCIKYSTYTYVQYVILDNSNKQLWYWLMYLRYYTFYHYFKVYFLLIKKKLSVKQYAVLCHQQPHTSCVYFISWLHRF